MYYTYMIRCEDNSIYTGITTDIVRRIEEHMQKDKLCAKYTKRHTAKKLEIAWMSDDRKLAAKLEYHIKTLTKAQKEKLIQNKDLEEVLHDKIDPSKYELYR